ncbi:choice-of-anchor I family protein [Aequorivita echinoideorum]|uniref:Choice-of-anchor I family protein n=1 Tax=Aequorivita echinoideorum TaxID=1549647 RepID=A0ABS5S7X1_9FLAO|nr:choice-of-anchor I family protein [Aequorivita echinoideorum]MBT0608534.1 choice-of-anchor I family protein [Aequorivita echinoideorum]
MKKITFIVAFFAGLAAFAQETLITGYVDSPCSGAAGRVLEIYVDGTVDLTGWAVQRQSNGGTFGSNIDLSTFGTITDSFIYLTNDDTVLLNEFGISTNVLVNGGISSNGDDAFQIIDNTAAVIDRFGENGVDGTGTAWEHEDSYYLRNNFSTPNAGNFVASNWTFGALQILDNQGLCYGAAALSTIVALGSYQHGSVVVAPQLSITEIFSGQEGADLTADWFEIENTGTVAYDVAVNGALFYDDDSAAGAEADIINGINTIQPGEFAILVIGNAADVTTFTNVWSPVINLTGVAIGFTDGAGLGAGGDAVTLWLNDPLTTSPIASGSYPDTAANDGQTYDVELSAFSIVGNSNGAVETIALGGTNSDVPNVGSPGNGPAVTAAFVQYGAPYASVSEDGGSVTVSVEVTQAPALAGTVDVNLVAGGTAVEGTDFTFANTQTLTFVAGSTAPQTITIPIIDNTVDGSDIFFVLGLSNATNIQLGSEDLFSVYILDDDTEVPVANTSELDANYLTSYLVDAGGTAEITAYDPATQRLFVTTVGAVEILDFSDPENISSIETLDITSFGNSVQSVAVSNGILAAAIAANDPTDNGSVVFMDTDGNNAVSVEVGSLPDMLTFTPDGTKLLVANEGQPSNDYTIDPEGSISVIDVTGGLSGITQANVTTLNFNAFDAQQAALVAAGVRIFGPGASVSQDLEPEYIAVSNDSQMAYVTLQENNAYAIVDLSTMEITDVISFGLKDHSLAENSLDTSDETDFIFNASWPVKGVYMPDAVSFYSVNGMDYIVTANEGDARDYDGYAEERKLGDADFLPDPAIFTNLDILNLETNLGDINFTAASGDANGDGLYEELHVFGGRSFSIFEAATGNLVYDSGNDFEVITAADPTLGGIFNASNDNNNFKNRSDNKGPEPEGVLVKEINNEFYAFILLERIGGMMVYNVTDPTNPVFLQYLNSRGTVPGDPESGDLGPEGIVYVEPADSPTGNALVILSNEVSATLSIFSLDNVTLSTNDFDLADNTFAMYPNPAQDVVFFSKPSNYNVYDMLGILVKSEINSSSIKINGLKTGTYIVKNTEGISKKLIVK